MIKKISKLLIVASFFITYSCRQDEKPDDVLVEDENTIQAVEETKLNAQNVFNSLPDRKLVLSLIQENQIAYNPDLLNDPGSVNKYTIEFFKAVNLGIYGTDLNIASSFEQMQESMMFLKCVNLLSGSIGVNNIFDQRLFDRIQTQEGNKDSVLQIVTDAFKKVDETLKYNNRPATSAFILSGCWIEGLYVACHLSKTVNSENIIKNILKQKESLKNLIIMLESSNLNDDSKFITDDLRALYRAFEVAETKSGYNQENLLPITDLVSALRKRIVSGV
jgi:hypothetical protein